MKPSLFDRPPYPASLNDWQPLKSALKSALKRTIKSVMKPQRQPFHLSGRVQSIQPDKTGRCKFLQLVTGGRVERIKLAKPLRSRLGAGPQVGTWVALSGKAKLNPQTGQFTFKARQLAPWVGSRFAGPAPQTAPGRSGALLRQSPGPQSQNHASAVPTAVPSAIAQPPMIPTSTPVPPDLKTTAKPVAKVLICQKANCRKRGGDRTCQAIAQAIADRGWGDRVQLQPTGCLKACDRGPVAVTLPDKTRHTRLKPQEAAELIDRHFG
ncbi:MAG: (2Fe-2S) ferredoxin domain-containing protein [Oscillatoriales cyanobacterium]|nr:MAG: (2Fe-2S) ferredoxin domain-containing protein [Oscillatoriales cyanobacterium]